MSYLLLLRPRSRWKNPVTVKDLTMALAISLAVALAPLGSSHLLYGQDLNPAPNPSGPGILKDYDQAIDAIAERAMQSVVEIEVTGYGVPEKDKDSDDQSPPLERQRSLGS